MVRFSEEQQNVLTKEELKNGMEDLGIQFILIPPKKETLVS